MASAEWKRQVRKWRAYFRPLLPVPCSRCGRPVNPDDRWHVDHIVEQVYGGTHTVDNLWPAHARCNEAAGGRIGGSRRRRTPSKSSEPTTKTYQPWNW